MCYGVLVGSGGGLCAAEEGEDLCVEEPEVSSCETRAEESIPAQKPVSRAKLEARADSVQVPRCCVAPKPREALSISCPNFYAF